MHRNFEAMNIGKEPPDDNGKAPRPMKTYAAGALAAAAELALFSLVAGSESIASLGGDAQEKWNDVPCPAGMEVPKVDANSRVLVTGGAGFIGMSLMASLGKRDAKTKPAVVIGIDSFNDYYAPAMKRGRAQRLKTEFGYDVIEAGVCDTAVIDKLFEQHRFTHVVHLAAQAGVRYSITHHDLRAQQLRVCRVALGLRGAQEAAAGHVYASSSSVYGLNKKIPFSELHAIDHPANLYGTSKFGNEQIAAAYHNIHGLKSVGLRFFTVYGPWGRPDMAVSLFTNKIENGETITLFNGGEMWRDFTFVDDIVQGIELSMEYCSDNAAVFNLGNSKPVKLATSSSRSRSAWGQGQVQVPGVERRDQGTYADVQTHEPWATSRRPHGPASTISWPRCKSSTSGRAAGGPRPLPRDYAAARPSLPVKLDDVR